MQKLSQEHVSHDVFVADERRRFIREFSRLYPEANFESVSFDQVPDSVQKIFEELSSNYMHPDGSRSYITQKEKTFGYDEQRQTEKLLYCADVDEEGQLIGYGEVSFRIDRQSNPYFYQKPYMAGSYTTGSHQGGGLGKRRLRYMNAASRTEFGFRLNSDSNLTESAAKTWEGLVRTGEAKKYEETEGVFRYVFV